MSENTVFLISEQVDGTFNVTRHWFEEGLPELGGGERQEGVTLREATDYCGSQHAEYGYQINWLEKEEPNA